MSNNTKAAYAVEVIGFNQTERIVLSSIFGLSARRSPKFLQHTTVTYSPDLYLVDAADPQAVALFQARNASYKIGAIFIGDTNHGTPFPVLARPLQWTRLFKAFDLAIATSAAASQAPALSLEEIFQSTLPSSMSIGASVERELLTQTITQTAAPSAVSAPARPLTLAPDAATPITARAPNVLPALPTTAPTTAPPMTTRTSVNATSIETSAPKPSTPTPGSARAAPPPTRIQSPVAANADWVLVVDDNVTVREFMRTKLAPFGFNVDYAESGEQAVGFTGQKSYTCVFLDVIMPGIDGYQVCKLIKSKKAATKTAVVMLTSKGSPFDRIRGAMAGCDAYLTKPVDEDKLLETIVKFLPIPTIR